MKITPNLTVVAPNKFGVRIEYYGPLQDTCGIIAGFIDGGPCVSTGSPVSAMRSYFWPNSYYWHNLWAPIMGNDLIPTEGGGTLYWDCDGSATYTPFSNEENFIQDLSIWTYVTIDGNTGILEKNLNENVKIYPNPFTETTTFELITNINNSKYFFELYDFLGREVKAIENIISNTFQIQRDGLSEGLYIYKLFSEEGMLGTGKLVVQD